MREFANDILIVRDIHFDFRASPGAQELAIGADTRRQVFLIFKECLHNVIRHAHCTHVEIGLNVDSDRLVVQVRDNGGGFESAAASNGHGLVSMRDRAQRLGGTIVIAADGRGTAVTLEIPLAKTPA
jgi:signal transduction histidine kinase